MYTGLPLPARRTLIAALLCAGFNQAQAQAQDVVDDTPPVTTLSSVVVSASGFEQSVQDAPASITVVPQEELAKRAYPDVTEALKDIPGVVITGGGSASDISIRGMGSNYTMILVDGMRQNTRETRPNSDAPGIEQGWLPPLEAIERIEVIRGPMSSLYGSDAMGGVVNIITRKVAQQWRGSLRTESTLQENSLSGNIYAGNFHIAGPLAENLLGLQVYGNWSRRSEDRFVNGFNKQETRAGTVKLTLTPSANHDLTLEVGRTRQDKVATPGRSSKLGSYKKKDKKCDPKKTTCEMLWVANTLSEDNYARNLYSLSHNGRYGLVSSASHISREETDNPGRDMFLKNSEASTQWTTPVANHVLTAGASLVNEALTDKGNELPSEVNKLERYQWALYAEDEWSLTDSFALTGGVRMTRDENYGTHWTPRVYGVWHATERFSVKGGVSTGFKAPGLRAAVADWGQVTGGGGKPSAVIVGNPGLKPESSISQEISLNWDNRDDFASSLTFFNTDFKDKISEVRRCTDDTFGINGSTVVTGNCEIDGKVFKFISDRVNVDKANMRGIEATMTWQLHEQVRLATNYTFTRSEQKSGKFKGQALNKMPRHMANATLDYTPTDALDVWARWNLRGKTSEYLSRTSMAKGTPSFAFVDLGVRYQLRKNVSLGLAVYNVLDKQVTSEDFGATHDGRRYWLSLTAGF